MNPRWAAADAACGRGWSNPHDPEERPKRNLDPIGESRHFPGQNEWRQLEMRIREVIRKEASSRHETAPGIGNSGLDGEDLHFQRVPWLCPFDPNRTGENVRDFPAVLDLAFDLQKGGLHLIPRQSGRLQCLTRASRQRFNIYRIPRADAKHGRCIRVKVSPRDSFGRWR